MTSTNKELGILTTPKTPNPVIRASFLIALSGVLYGFLGYLGTGVLQDHLSVSTMLFWRFFIAAVCIFLLIIKKKESRQTFQLANKRGLFILFFLGIAGYAGASGFYFVATKYIGTGLSMVIFFSYPMLVALSSWVFYKQQFSIMTLLALFTMLVGLVFLQHSATPITVNMLGLIFSGLAALSYTIYVMGTKKYITFKMEPNLGTLMVCLGGAFIFLLLAFLFKEFSFPLTLKGWSYLLALSILSTVMPIQLMLNGLKHVSSMRASIISVLEPLVTLLVAMALLHEPISHLQWLGVFLLIFSTLTVQFQRGL